MHKLVYLFCVMVFVSACTKEESSQADGKKTPAVQTNNKVVKRSFDFARLTRGEKLFQQNCATCHGQEAQGVSNWRQRDDAGGKFPAPPLNGTGHAWHHPQKALISTIQNGTVRMGGSMPPWRDKLSDQDIGDIINWFQSKWTDEIYTVWYQRNKQLEKAR